MEKDKFFKLISGVVTVVFFINSSVSAAPFTSTTSLASTLRPNSAANKVIWTGPAEKTSASGRMDAGDTGGITHLTAQLIEKLSASSKFVSDKDIRAEEAKRGFSAIYDSGPKDAKAERDVVILSMGIATANAIEAAEELAKLGISCRVIDINRIKKMVSTQENINELVKLLRDCRYLITVAGIKTAILEEKVSKVIVRSRLTHFVDMAHLDIHDFGESGEPQELDEKHDFDTKGILIRALQMYTSYQPTGGKIDLFAPQRVDKKQKQAKRLLKKLIASQRKAYMDELSQSFDISAEEMLEIISEFEKEMARGLTGKASSLKMLSAFINNPTGKEKGIYMGIDLGGENLRFVIVKLSGNRKYRVLYENKREMKPEQFSQEDEIFDAIAVFIKEGLEEFQAKKHISSAKPVNYKAGFTFSFPVKQTGIAKGKIVELTKGWGKRFPKLIGQDPVALLKEALSQNNVDNVDIVALCNDTVGTLVTRAYQDLLCIIGAILGTGTNIAAVIDGIIRNLESGGFNKLRMTEFDKELDAISANPRRQILEKQVSGKYLPEAVRLIICDLIKRGLLFDGRIGPELVKFSKPYSLETKYMSKIEKDRSSNLYGVKTFLEKGLGIEGSTIEERRMIKQACELVSGRGAKVFAPALAAALFRVLLRIDPSLSKPRTLAIDGSVYEFHPTYAKNMNEEFKVICKERFGDAKKAKNIRIKLTKGGSSIGPAIIAAIVDTKGVVKETKFSRARSSSAGKVFTFGKDLSFLREYLGQDGVKVLSDKSGQAQLTVVPKYQGRVMTSTANGLKGMSYGWINRELIASGEVREHINVYGGEDRFWIGPEGGQYSIFFKKGVPFDLEHWFTPAVIDTEPFDIIFQQPDAIGFRKQAHLENYSGTKFKIQIDRTVRLLDRQDARMKLGLDRLPKGVKLVVYESLNEIKNIGEEVWDKDKGLLSIWILGMYNPSADTTIVIPYEPGPGVELGPIVNDAYFGKVPPDRLAIGEKALFFKGDGQQRGKIGLSSKRAKPILGSYDAANKVLTLVQYTKPIGITDFVNSMWELQEDPYAGDVVNSYNDGPPEPGAKPLGPFYELETSSAALKLRPGNSSSHLHRTFHIQGPEEVLDKIARHTLGAGLEEIKAVFKQPKASATDQDSKRIKSSSAGYAKAVAEEIALFSQTLFPERGKSKREHIVVEYIINTLDIPKLINDITGLNDRDAKVVEAQLKEHEMLKDVIDKHGEGDVPIYTSPESPALELMVLISKIAAQQGISIRVMAATFFNWVKPTEFIDRLHHYEELQSASHKEISMQLQGYPTLEIIWSNYFDELQPGTRDSGSRASSAGRVEIPLIGTAKLRCSKEAKLIDVLSKNWTLQSELSFVLGILQKHTNEILTKAVSRVKGYDPEKDLESKIRGTLAEGGPSRAPFKTLNIDTLRAIGTVYPYVTEGKTEEVSRAYIIESLDGKFTFALFPSYRNPDRLPMMGLPDEARDKLVIGRRMALVKEVVEIEVGTPPGPRASAAGKRVELGDLDRVKVWETLDLKKLQEKTNQATGPEVYEVVGEVVGIGERGLWGRLATLAGLVQDTGCLDKAMIEQMFGSTDFKEVVSLIDVPGFKDDKYLITAIIAGERGREDIYAQAMLMEKTEKSLFKVSVLAPSSEQVGKLIKANAGQENRQKILKVLAKQTKEQESVIAKFSALVTHPTSRGSLLRLEAADIHTLSEHNLLPKKKAGVLISELMALSEAALKGELTDFNKKMIQDIFAKAGVKIAAICLIPGYGKNAFPVLATAGRAGDKYIPILVDWMTTLSLENHVVRLKPEEAYRLSKQFPPGSPEWEVLCSSYPAQYKADAEKASAAGKTETILVNGIAFEAETLNDTALVNKGLSFDTANTNFPFGKIAKLRAETRTIRRIAINDAVIQDLFKDTGIELAGQLYIPGRDDACLIFLEPEMQGYADIPILVWLDGDINLRVFVLELTIVKLEELKDTVFSGNNAAQKLLQGNIDLLKKQSAKSASAGLSVDEAEMRIKELLAPPFTSERLQQLDGFIDKLLREHKDICLELLSDGSEKAVASAIIERLALPDVIRYLGKTRSLELIETARINSAIAHKAYGVYRMFLEVQDRRFVPFELPDKFERLGSLSETFEDTESGISDIRFEYHEVIEEKGTLQNVTKPPRTTILEQHPNAAQYFMVEEGGLVILVAAPGAKTLKAYSLNRGDIVRISPDVHHIAVNRTDNVKFYVFNQDPNSPRKKIKPLTKITCIGNTFNVKTITKSASAGTTLAGKLSVSGYEFDKPDKLFADLGNKNSQVRKRAVEAFKKLYPELTEQIEAYYKSLPLPGKVILNAAKQLGVRHLYPFKVKRYTTEGRMGNGAANAVFKRLKKWLKENQANGRDYVVMNFAAAPSQDAFLARFVKVVKEAGLKDHGDEDYYARRIIGVHIDEYEGLEEGHPAQFKTYLKDHLIDKLNLKAFYFMDDYDDEAYMKKIKKLGGIDITCCGIGENTHIGFNDPPADFISKGIKRVKLSRKCRIQQIHDYPHMYNPENLKLYYKVGKKRKEITRNMDKVLKNVPEYARSMTPKTMIDAKDVFVIVPRPSKAEPIKAFFENDLTPNIPCTFLRTHPNMRLYVDEYSADPKLISDELIKEVSSFEGDIALGRPVPAPYVDIGPLTALYIPAIMKAAKDMNSIFMVEVGPGALLTFDSKKESLAQYSAQDAQALYEETGYVVNYTVHGDHNQMTKMKVDEYDKADKAKRKEALQEILDRQNRLLDEGALSVTIVTSTLTRLEQKNVRKRLKYVIDTCNKALEALRQKEQELGIEISIEGEVGDIGKEVSTVEEAITYVKELKRLIDLIALQLGTAHGYEFDENDKIIPYIEVTIDLKRAREVVDAFKKMGLDIRVAQRGFSGTPIELVYMFLDKGIGKVNINTDWQAIIWKVTQAWYPKLYWRLYKEAYKGAVLLAKKKAKEALKKAKQALKTVKQEGDPEKIKKAQEKVMKAQEKLDKLYFVSTTATRGKNFEKAMRRDFKTAKNRIIFGKGGTPGIRKLFRKEEYRELLEEATRTLKKGKRRMSFVERTPEEAREDYLNVRLEVKKDPEGLTALEAIQKLVYERMVELMEAMELRDSADKVIKIDREAELRLQKWQVKELRSRVEELTAQKGPKTSAAGSFTEPTAIGWNVDEAMRKIRTLNQAAYKGSPAKGVPGNPEFGGRRRNKEIDGIIFDAVMNSFGPEKGGADLAYALKHGPTKIVFKTDEGGENLIGYVIYGKMPSDIQPLIEVGAYIHLMPVHPDSRNQGIGEELFRRTVAFARKNNLDKIALSANVSSKVKNPDIDFYDSLGKLPEVARFSIRYREYKKPHSRTKLHTYVYEYLLKPLDKAADTKSSAAGKESEVSVSEVRQMLIKAAAEAVTELLARLPNLRRISVLDNTPYESAPKIIHDAVSGDREKAEGLVGIIADNIQLLRTEKLTGYALNRKVLGEPPIIPSLDDAGWEFFIEDQWPKTCRTLKSSFEFGYTGAGGARHPDLALIPKHTGKGNIAWARRKVTFTRLTFGLPIDVAEIVSPGKSSAAGKISAAAEAFFLNQMPTVGHALSLEGVTPDDLRKDPEGGRLFTIKQLLKKRIINSVNIDNDSYLAALREMAETELPLESFLTELVSEPFEQTTEKKFKLTRLAAELIRLRRKDDSLIGPWTENTWALVERSTEGLVAKGASLFAPEWRKTDRRCGYVSISLPASVIMPYYASEPENEHAKRIVEAATAKLERIYAKIKELTGKKTDNIFINIPASKPGLLAGEALIILGYNINFTHVATRRQYEAAVRAWKEGAKGFVDTELQKAAKKAGVVRETAKDRFRRFMKLGLKWDYTSKKARDVIFENFVADFSQSIRKNLPRSIVNVTIGDVDRSLVSTLTDESYSKMREHLRLRLEKTKSFEEKAEIKWKLLMYEALAGEATSEELSKLTGLSKKLGKQILQKFLERRVHQKSAYLKGNGPEDTTRVALAFAKEVIYPTFQREFHQDKKWLEFIEKYQLTEDQMIQRINWTDIAVREQDKYTTNPFYIAGLLSADTISALPREVIYDIARAEEVPFKPEVQIDKGRDKAEAVLKKLKEIGIDLSLLQNEIVENKLAELKRSILKGSEHEAFKLVDESMPMVDKVENLLAEIEKMRKSKKDSGGADTSQEKPKASVAGKTILVNGIAFEVEGLSYEALVNRGLYFDTVDKNFPFDRIANLQRETKALGGIALNDIVIQNLFEGTGIKVSGRLYIPGRDDACLIFLEPERQGFAHILILIWLQGANRLEAFVPVLTMKKLQELDTLPADETTKQILQDDTILLEKQSSKSFLPDEPRKLSDEAKLDNMIKSAA